VKFWNKPNASDTTQHVRTDARIYDYAYQRESVSSIFEWLFPPHIEESSSHRPVNDARIPPMHKLTPINASGQDTPDVRVHVALTPLLLVEDNVNGDRPVRVMRVPSPIGTEFETRQEEEIDSARKIFAHRFSTREKKKRPPTSYQRNNFGHLQLSDGSYRYRPIPNSNALFTHIVGHTGIMVDTTRFFFPMERLKSTVDWLSKLGFNTLHLRVTDDFAFAMKTQLHPNMAWASKKDGHVYSSSGLKELSQYADSLGVEIFPEINVVSRAGGWFAGGFVSPCPNHVCSQGYGIPLNLSVKPIMAVVANIIDESRFLFNSPFLHLGYDEREESRPCLEESGIRDLDYDSVEQKLMALMSILEIPSRHVIRWESSDSYPEQGRKRAGMVTHYHLTNPPLTESNPFFVTTDLGFNDIHHDAWSTFLRTRNYTRYENILGIMAGTLEMSPQAWSALNVKGRLIAMAIGASALQIPSEEAFREVYEQACNHMKFSECQLYGKARTSFSWETERNQQRELRKNATCIRLTRWTSTRGI
jgi:hypothetical protein